MATLGEVIRARRIELGLTQEALAERIGETMRQSEISRLEQNQVTLPRRERLEALAAALDLPVGHLLVHSGWVGAEQAFPVAVPPERTSTVPAETKVELEEVLAEAKGVVAHLEELVDTVDSASPDEPTPSQTALSTETDAFA